MENKKNEPLHTRIYLQRKLSRGKGTNLVAVDKVFPFTFTLVGTPAKRFLLHLARDKLPQRLVSLGLREIFLQLCPNSDKLFCLMVTPLWNALFFLPSPIHRRQQRHVTSHLRRPLHRPWHARHNSQVVAHHPHPRRGPHRESHFPQTLPNPNSLNSTHSTALSPTAYLYVHSSCALLPHLKLRGKIEPPHAPLDQITSPAEVQRCWSTRKCAS